MKKKNGSIKTTLLCIVAGITVLKFAQEIPAMVRYYKMKRL